MRKVITLAELLIAISLLGLVVLAVGTFEVAALRMYRKQDYRSEVLIAVSFIIQHLDRHIRGAIGDMTNRGIRVIWQANTSACNFSNCYVDIRNDLNNTPSDYSDDIIRRYAYNYSLHTVRFYPDTSNLSHYIDLSSRIVDCKFSFDSSQGVFRIEVLRGRYLPDKPPSFKNPQVSIPSTINLFPFPHSLN